MSRQHIDHSDLKKFAEDRVNLSRDNAKKYREQVARLREKLGVYLDEHDQFSLSKTLLAGSLAKGTALKTLNDIDVACYITGANSSTDVRDLLDYLKKRLEKAHPNFSPDQIQPQTYSVTVSYRGTGLDVDVVPIIYDGNTEWYGNLISQDDGTALRTNIPLHLDFLRKRKSKSATDFAQVVRLAKFWAKKMKEERDGFRFKSFIIEMIFSHLSDKGLDFSDYPEALQHFFTYLAGTGLKDQISFTDCYNANQIPRYPEPVRIIDPVNEKNNVARLYTQEEARAITEAAMDAGDAIDSALAATTKQDTIYYWQKVFGTTFQ